MARGKARRRRKRRQRLQQIAAWTLLFLFEIAIAVVPAFLAAAILLPLAWSERGYAAMGSEWFMIAAVFCIAYGMTHKRVCDRIFRQED